MFKDPGAEVLDLSHITLIKIRGGPYSYATPMSNMPQRRDSESLLMAKADPRTHGNAVLE